MTIKKIYSIAAIFILFLQFSCDKADELTKFDLSYESYFTVPSTAEIAIPLQVNTPPVTTNSEQKFSSNNTRADLVEQILIKSIDLEVTSPTGGDFSFLESVEVYLSADGLPDVLIASKSPVSQDIGSTLSMDIEDVDIKEYVFKDQFVLSTSVTTDEAILQDHEIKVKSVFTVDAKILGL